FKACHSLALVKGFAFANDRERKVRQWRKVAARADRTFFRNDRMNAALKQRNQSFDNERPRAAVAQSQHVCAQEQHGSRLCFGERRADAAGMAAHQVQLQLAQLRMSYPNVCELAKACVDSVNDSARLRNLFNDAARFSHTLARLSR